MTGRGARRGSAVMAGAAIALASLAGCGDSATEETASPSTTADAVVEARVPVVGTESRIAVEAGPTVSQAGDIRQQRDEVWIWEDETSDARVNGTRRTTINLDERPDGSADMWGTSVLANDGGTWEGEWIGSIRADGTHFVHSVSLGTGDYEGLQYVFFLVFAEPTGEFTSASVISTSGWIEPAT